MKVNSLPLDDAIAGAKLPQPLAPISVASAMQLAHLTAWRGIGRTSPNPLVGAVMVDREHRFLAAGAHMVYGGAHAEVGALRELSPESLQGATCYVTLEPCAHQGKTPACAAALARLPLHKVVFATVDPNPKVSGRGAQQLRDAGIVVESPAEFADLCAAMNAPFLLNQRRQRPFVALKIAATLNGVAARRARGNLWITGARARAYGHFLRGWYDAMLVGVTTVLLDNPALSARHPELQLRHPRRVVLDPYLEAATLPPDAIRLLQHQPQECFWVVAADLVLTVSQQAFVEALLARGVEILRVPHTVSFDLADLLQQLYQKNICSVLVEGGPKTAQAFLAARLVDHLHLFQAPVLWGGDDAIFWNSGLVAGDDWRAQDVQLTHLKEDWLIDVAVIS